MESSALARDDRSNDRGIDSLAPDHMTPDQFAGLIRRHSWRAGEHRLLAAVLQDGIETFHKLAFSSSVDKREEFAEVYRWLVDREDHSLFAFTTICDVLDLNPECLREGLLTWLDQNRRRTISIGARNLADPRRRVEQFAKTA